MSKMSSLASAFSGLKAAQAGLYVTGHNIANAETAGYVRQRTLQKDTVYHSIGNNALGEMQVGLGTDTYGIRQIRDRFLDMSYRKEASKLGFHEAKAEIGRELEIIIGELQSDYRMEAILSDMWGAINELSLYQPGLDTLGNFISTCTTFVNKANNVYERMYDYMRNIDGQITKCVSDINSYLDRINELNSIIFSAELSGDSANDYRDERNTLLDELSLLIPIYYTEDNKQVKILSEGNELLANGHVVHIGLKYYSEDYTFVEPVLTESKEILQWDTHPSQYRSVFDLTSPVDAVHGNDNGELKALLSCRGYMPANYASDAESIKPDPTDTTLYPDGRDDLQYKIDYQNYQKLKFNNEYALIPKTMKEFDTIVNSIIEMINNAVSPIKEESGIYVKDTDNAPYGLDGSQFEEIFVRKHVDRFDGDTYNPEDPNDYFSLYTIGNIELNPIFADSNGYNKIALSLSGDQEDTRLVIEELLAKWNGAVVPLSNGQVVSVNEAYQYFTNELSIETSNSINYAERQSSLIVEVDNKRMMISAVSLDEELEMMMIFNRAYGAAARVVNVIDGMLDRVINNLGRVGI